MLVFEDVVFKNILNHVNATFPQRTYLVGANREGKTTLLRMLCKNRKISSGEIFLQENFLEIQKKIPNSKNLFFFIPSDIYTKWSGIKLKTIYKLFTRKTLENTGLCREYKLDADMRFEGLNNFEKLIFYTHIAMEKNALIILYDEPIKVMDYLEREQFDRFLMKYANQLSFIISTNHIESNLLKHIEGIFLLKNKKIEKITYLKGAFLLETFSGT